MLQTQPLLLIFKVLHQQKKKIIITDGVHA